MYGGGKKDSLLDWWRRVLTRTAITFCFIIVYVALACIIIWGLVQGVMFVNNKVLHWGEIGLVFWTVLIILGLCSFLIATTEE